LTAVFYDLQVDSYIIGCRALGLINKFVTGPLWRLLESNTHILDLSFQFQKMETLFSELAVDASRILKDDVVFFPDFPISKDVVFEKLIRPSKVFDEGTKQCLEILFGSFSIITKRMLHDHLQGGKYVCSEELSKVSFGVSKTNSISERDFGMLDRLIREKPNANQITLEAIIMTRTNKMSSWRDSLTEEKRKKIMEWARLSKVEQFQSFKRRRENVRQQQEEKQLDKIEVREKKELKTASEKERLTVVLEEFGGLWKSEEEVRINVDGLDTEKLKREALKAQLQFRQKVLAVPGIEKTLYRLSEKGNVKSSDLLKANLIVVINHLTSRVDSEITQPSFSTIIPVDKLRAQKVHLKELVERESEKIVKKTKPAKKISKTAKKSFLKSWYRSPTTSKI